MIGFDFFNNPEPPSSQDLEKAWRPMTCIAAFGPGSLDVREQFPRRQGTCSYQVLWNAFKRSPPGTPPTRKPPSLAARPERHIGCRYEGPQARRVIAPVLSSSSSDCFEVELTGVEATRGLNGCSRTPSVTLVLFRHRPLS